MFAVLSVSLSIQEGVPVNGLSPPCTGPTSIQDLSPVQGPPYRYVQTCSTWFQLSPPPYGPKFSQFHSVFRKIWQNHMLAPPRRVGAPSNGESWIRPCLVHMFEWVPTLGKQLAG